MSTLDSILAAIESFFNSIFGGQNKDEIKSAIENNIANVLDLPDAAVNALYAQAAFETGDFKSHVFLRTRSLFNRHVGSGKGYWTGQRFHASPQDSDLRIYTDVWQSAHDMSQLLSDPLYAAALEDLREGNINAYFRDVAKAGFSASKNYAENLEKVYATIA